MPVGNGAGHALPVIPGRQAGARRGSAALPSSTCPCRLPKELGRVNVQDLSQLLDDLQANVGHGPLDPAEVGPVHPSIVRQPLLRELPVMPDAPEVCRKNLA